MAEYSETKFLDPSQDFDTLASSILVRLSSVGSDPRKKKEEGEGGEGEGEEREGERGEKAKLSDSSQLERDSLKRKGEREGRRVSPDVVAHGYAGHYAPMMFPYQHPGDDGTGETSQPMLPFYGYPHPYAIPPPSPQSMQIPSISVNSPTNEREGSGRVIGYSMSLQGEELRRFSRLGLGKAIDATLPHPWASKSSYQAREVTEGDLDVINEGQHVKNFVEVTEDYIHMQGSLEATLKTPDNCCNVGVAADAHRSLSETHVLRGKMVKTRTISFKVVGPSERDRKKTNFERQLERFVERERITPMEPGVMKSEEDICYDFLRSLGGVTHYVSSITLGAMEYTVRKTAIAPSNTAVRSTSGIGNVASVQRRVNSMRTMRRPKIGSVGSEKIGRIKDDSVKVHSHDEGVIMFSFMPLTNLVSKSKLQESLKRATLHYIHSQLRRKNGPFHIMTPEVTARGSHLYWQVRSVRGNEGRMKHFIGCTTDISKASSFYIRPDYSVLGQFFFITTTDRQNSQQRKTSTVKAERTPTHPPSEHSVQELEENTTDKKAGAEGGMEERYVHVNQTQLFKFLPGSRRILLEARVIVDKKYARFELIDRTDHLGKAVLETNWLPEEGEGQPFFLRPTYQPSLCLGVTGFQHYSNPYSFCIKKKSRHEEGRCHMLYTLIQARSREES